MDERLGASLADALLAARLDDDSETVRALLARARAIGDDVAGGLAEHLAATSNLHEWNWHDRAAAAVDVVVASRSIVAIEVLLHAESGAVADESLPLEGRLLDEFRLQETPWWPPLLLELRRRTLADEPLDLVVRDRVRDACIAILTYAPKGTPGLLEVLLEDLITAPAVVVPALVRHGGPAQGPILLEWLRTLVAPDALPSERRDAVMEAGEVLLDWGITLTESDHARVESAWDATACLLASLNDLDFESLPNLWDTYDPATSPRRVRGPDGACPCRSGRKARHCCGGSGGEEPRPPSPPRGGVSLN